MTTKRPIDEDEDGEVILSPKTSRSGGSNFHEDIVAPHYNRQALTDNIEQRVQSRIFYLRNFNNWIKSVLISEFLFRVRKEFGQDVPLNVLDFCCGKGGDLQKWKRGGVSHVAFVDIAEAAIETCMERYSDMKRRNDSQRFPEHFFTSEFLVSDCFSCDADPEKLGAAALLPAKLRHRSFPNAQEQFHLTSCMFSFHYAFQTRSQVEIGLRNASVSLKMGGYFIGVMPNACEVMKRLNQEAGPPDANGDVQFGNSVYKIRFPKETLVSQPSPDREQAEDGEADDQFRPKLFGSMYHFQLEGVVECPEFLAYVPVLERMAESFGLKLVMSLNIPDFFKFFVKQSDACNLLSRMNALEPFPPEADVELVSKDFSQYAHAKKFLDAHTGQPGHAKIGTLTKDEWEAIGLYVVFAFKKVSADRVSEKIVESVDISAKKISHRHIGMVSKPNQPPPTSTSK